MVKKIRKRDGSVVPFDKEKTLDAIWRAVKAVGGDDKTRCKIISDLVVETLTKKYGEVGIPEVEEVQDLVEKMLIEEGHAKVAKAYILYRKSHDELRNIKGLFDTIEVIDDYIGLDDWMIKENSNMGFSLQGLNNYIATKIITNYWVRRVYPEALRKAHEEGEIHIHDLGTLGAYCVGWDLQDLLMVGFTGVPGKVHSKPAKHLRTALGQMVNFFYTLQGETAGAQAFSNFDTLLAPFVRYDNLDYKEVKQALQEFLFNMAVPTRVGFQTPFTNITMDLKVPNYMKDEPVIIGGVSQKETYKEFQDEMDLINKAFAECMLEGDAQGRVFTFPIPTYNITSDFDWDNPNYDMIWEMTAKYGIPYFSNFINSDMKPEDARSMCPLAGDEKVLIKSSRGRNLEFGEIRNIFRSQRKGDYEIFSDGGFVKGKFNQFKNQKMIKVVLENGHKIKMSQKHLNFVKILKEKSQRVLKGVELREGMYLPYSLNLFEGKGGNKDLGYFVGAYAGDGSFDGDTGVVFSLEGNFKKEIIPKLKQIAENYFGANCSIINSKKSKLITLRVNSSAAVGLCKDFVDGKERYKCYKAKLFGMSAEFRKAVLEGHHATDGGNRNRIYTSSRKMVESLNILSATLGTTTSIYEDNRGGRFGSETNYAVLIYQLNRNNYGNIWFKEDKKLWVRIKKIMPVSNTTAYCFEVKKGTPIFTVGTTGILTHNCRLRLDQTELRKRGGGLFGSNPQTGSIGVVTINMPRIGFTATDEDDFFKKLGNLMEISKESLEIKRKAIENFTIKGLYPYSKFYLRQVYQRFGKYWKNHFATIGLLGMNESIMNFMPGENIGTPKGKEFTSRVLDFMRKKLEEYQVETGNIYNLESTPAEGTSYRLARMDKKRYGRIIVGNERSVRNENAEPYYTNCVSEDTECLSINGWKKYNELKKGDLILTLDTNNNQLKYQPILYMNVQNLKDKEMYNIKSARQNQLVTPNHKVLYDGNRKRKYQFSTPQNLPHRLVIPMAGEYKLSEIKKVSDDFVRLIGWIVTEGHFEKDNNAIRITQADWCNKQNFDEINKLLIRLKIKYSVLGDKRGKSIFRISAKDGENIRKHISSKSIPRWCLNNLPFNQQKILLDTLIKGDGSVSKHSMYYSTGSKKLADEFQELCIKCDIRAIINNYKDKCGAYHIVPSVHSHTEINKHNVHKTRYSGYVWCPTVENGTWIARRDDKPFITGNSTQLPVNYTDDLFEALDLQDDLQTKYTGGTVFHGFVGERIPKEAVKQLVKKIASNYRLPYFTITPVFSICPKHGYLSGEQEYCPKCDAELIEKGYVIPQINN